MKCLTYILVAALAILVFYFSWLPNPDIGSASYFPKAIGKWINHYGNLRTAVPFFILAAVLELGFVQDIDKKKKRVLVLSSLFIVVTSAELGQLFLTNRHFDLWDIFWGTVGAVAGMWFAVIGKRVGRKRK